MQKGQIMKTILHNAKVYVEKGCYTEAVFVEDGYIRKTGTDEEILSMRDTGTEVIDLSLIHIFLAR